MRAEVLQAVLLQAGKAAASPFDHQQREQEETLLAPMELGLSEVNLRSDAPRAAVPPGRELPLIISADRIRVQQSNYQSSFPARKPSEHFSKALQLAEVQLPAHRLFFPISLLASSRSPVCFISKTKHCRGHGKEQIAVQAGLSFGNEPPPDSPELCG